MEVQDRLLAERVAAGAVARVSKGVCIVACGAVGLGLGLVRVGESVCVRKYDDNEALPRNQRTCLQCACNCVSHDSRLGDFKSCFRASLHGGRLVAAEAAAEAAAAAAVDNKGPQ